MPSDTYDTSQYKERQDHIRALTIEPPLDTIENIYLDRDYEVELTTTELSTICPKTGLPDFATLTITYAPEEFLVEEKSLKLYLTAYRNVGIYQEHATNKILEDFVAVVCPRRCRIKAVWNNRGGIAVVVTAEWKK